MRSKVQVYEMVNNTMVVLKELKTKKCFIDSFNLDEHNYSNVEDTKRVLRYWFDNNGTSRFDNIDVYNESLSVLQFLNSLNKSDLIYFQS